MEAPLVCDVETVGTPFDGHIVTLSWKELGESHAHVARFEDVPASVFDTMCDPARPFVSHTKYDARFLRLGHGIPVTGPFYDTQVMAWVLNENQSLSLDSLVYRYCHYKMDKRIKRIERRVLFLCDDGSTVPLDEAPIDQLYAYNLRDTEGTAELFETLWERMADGQWLDYFLQEEVPYTEVLLDMECRGFPVDLERTARLAEECELAHAEMDDDLHVPGLPSAFNLNSPDHLAAYLFSKVFELADSVPVTSDIADAFKSIPRAERLEYVNNTQGLLPPGFTVTKVGRLYLHGVWTLRGRGLRPLTKTDSGKWSVSRPALKTNYAAAKDEWCQMLLDYKQVDKLLTTYLRRFPERAVDGRLYGRFNQTGTKTGRLSSSEPNLQNIPTRGELGSRVRDLFRVTI